MMAASSVFHLADQRAISAAPILDDPVPPVHHNRRAGFMHGPGAGPWQRMAAEMSEGQSRRLPHREAKNFRTSCRAAGMRTRQLRVSETHTQVWILSRPRPVPTGEKEEQTGW